MNERTPPSRVSSSAPFGVAADTAGVAWRRKLEAAGGAALDLRRAGLAPTGPPHRHPPQKNASSAARDGVTAVVPATKKAPAKTILSATGVVRAGAGGGLCAVLGPGWANDAAHDPRGARAAAGRLTLDGAPYDARPPRRLRAAGGPALQHADGLETLEFQEMRNGATPAARVPRRARAGGPRARRRPARRRPGVAAAARAERRRAQAAERRARYRAGARARRADERPRLGGGALRFSCLKLAAEQVVVASFHQPSAAPSASLTC